MTSLSRTTLLTLLLCSLVAAASACAKRSDDERDNAANSVNLFKPNSTLAVSESPLPTTLVDTPRSGFAPTSPLPTLAAPTPTAYIVPWYGFKVIQAYPHDPNAFTQGLIFDDGWLYEGTGLRGRSTLRRVELETGVVNQVYQLPAQLFGEGVTIYGNRIIQLTWQSNIGFVYDKGSFELLQQFHYPTEGWGITHDGERLIMSDGSETLRFLDPETLTEIGQIDVYDDTGPVSNLNELEFVKGEIFANVWQTDRIARIHPQTGQVIGWIDLSGLLDPKEDEEPVDVLNGIAYDAGNDRLFVTGKLWPRLIEIKILETN